MRPRARERGLVDCQTLVVTIHSSRYPDSSWATPVGGESRVPVLWGFDYLPTATPWQEVVEDVTAW